MSENNRERRGPPFTLVLIVLLVAAIIASVLGKEEFAWTALVGAMVMTGLADKIER